MADKKPNPPEQPDQDPDLTKRVDDMMAAGDKDSQPAVSPDLNPQPREKPTSAPPLDAVYKPDKPKKPPIIIKLADEKSDEPGPPKEQAAASAAEPETETAELPATTPIDDQKTDEAVDDIAAKEGDTALALQDAKAAKQAKAVNGNKSSWKARLKSLLKNKWTWVGVGVVLLIIFALPFTRYRILGLVIKKPVTVTVLDSKTATPVSSAGVELGSATAKTDANGHAHLNAPLGKHTLQISKQYYTSLNTSYFVGFKSPGPVNEKLTATGRLVPITVVNKISGKPLAGAEVKVKGTTAKTNAKGQASVALPTAANNYAAAITLAGYNAAAVNVQVTNQAVKANIFQLTPTGHIYFLSNLSGKLDVVEANLDGTGRKTVLAGTGHEDPSNTTLLASRDWRYLALESSRDGGKPALYLIDTSNNKATEFDNSGADITLIGWYNHNFIYDLNKSTQPLWQTGREVIKSYDADHQQLNQLDQTQAEGSASSYAYQGFSNFYIVNGYVVYSTLWTTFTSDGSAYNTTGKTDSIRAITPTGQNKKDYQTFAVDTTNDIVAQLYKPQEVYFAVYDSNGGTNYYEYDNQAVKTTSISNGTFNASYPTYLISPSGSQTLWTELRDGQNALFVGDSDAGSPKQIGAGDYKPYGWYGNNYALVSKNSSQLYIMPSGGLSGGRQPLKITDYYKPAQTFPGYGYGYGGL
jgi:hypothetical protein